MTKQSRQIWLSIIVMMILSLIFLPIMAQAHQSSTAYLSLAPVQLDSTSDQLAADRQPLQGEYRLAVRDLALLLPIDANQDQAVTWQELLDQSTAIHSLLRDQMVFAQGATQPATNCPIENFQPLRLDQVAGLVYIDQRFTVQCPNYQASQPLSQLDYQILDQMDAGHRLILTYKPYAETTSDATARTWMAATGSIALTSAPSHLQIITSYLIEGTHHLLIGIDHLLFLFCLLLPAVYCWRQGQQQPVDRVEPAIRQTLWIATAFTVAHSITLSLAALQVVHVPARWIEAAIAASIALAALNNLYPVFKQRQAWIAFGFGLIHGFGFANVLSDLPLATTERVIALLSFNVGIELGQVVCILIFLPIALALRQTTFYRRVMLIGGSSLAVVIALLWMMQRLLGQQWIYG